MKNKLKINKEIKKMEISSTETKYTDDGGGGIKWNKSREQRSRTRNIFK